MDEATEEDINLIAWQLRHISQALTRAKRLEALRETFYQDLYHCIVYPSSLFDPLNPRELSVAPDAQAIRIIEAKERYDRLIMKEYESYIRWKSLLEWASDIDRVILIRYFQKKKNVKPEVIKELLERIKGRIEKEEEQLEILRYERLKKENREIALKVSRPAKVKRKISFYEDGGWVSMDEDEHKNYQQNKIIEQKNKEWEAKLLAIHGKFN